MTPDPAALVKVVWRVVYGMIRPGESPDELASAGFVALMRACALYKADLATIQTYTWTAVSRAITSHRLHERNYRRCRSPNSSSAVVHHRDGTPVPPRRLVMFSEIGPNVVLGNANLFAYEPEDEVTVRDTIRARLYSLLVTLPGRELLVLCLRFGLVPGPDDPPPTTLTGISKYMGLSRERVRQIEFRALKRLEKRISNLPEAARVELEELAAQW